MKEKIETIEISEIGRYIILVCDDNVILEEAERIGEGITEWGNGTAKFFILLAGTEAEVTFKRVD